MNILKHYNYFSFIFIYLIIFQSVKLEVVAAETRGRVIFGKCCERRTDITYVVGTYGKCAGMCEERPVCTAYSYHRLSWICRLHTQECPLETCVGFLHSKKENWTMVNSCLISKLYDGINVTFVVFVFLFFYTIFLYYIFF
jgi:hypothetical protein